MKIAVLLSGLTRQHEYGLETLKTHFKGHEVDVFCQTYTWKDLGIIVRDTWSKEITEDYYKNIKLSAEDILKLFNPKASAIEDYDHVSQLFTFMFLDIMHHPGMVMQNLYGNLTVISMHYGMMVVNNLRKNYEQEHNFKYDLIVRMRYDSQITRMAPIENYDLTKLNIPTGRDWGGINDQFAFGPPDLMDIYMSMFLEIVEVTKKINNYHPESMLFQYLTGKGLQDKLLRPNMDVMISISRPMTDGCQKGRV